MIFKRVLKRFLFVIGILLGIAQAYVFYLAYMGQNGFDSLGNIVGLICPVAFYLSHRIKTSNWNTNTGMEDINYIHTKMNEQSIVDINQFTDLAKLLFGNPEFRNANHSELYQSLFAYKTGVILLKHFKDRFKLNDRKIVQSAIIRLEEVISCLGFRYNQIENYESCEKLKQGKKIYYELSSDKAKEVNSLLLAFCLTLTEVDLHDGDITRHLINEHVSLEDIRTNIRRNPDQPRVFIYYNYKTALSIEIAYRVSKRLNNSGINCIIEDYLDDSFKGDLFNWFNEELLHADIILLLVTDNNEQEINRIGNQSTEKPENLNELIAKYSDKLMFITNENPASISLPEEYPEKPSIDISGNLTNLFEKISEVSSKVEDQIIDREEMNPGKKLYDGYKALSIFKQFKIAEELNLSEGEEKITNKHRDKLTTTFFVRAKNRGELHLLWNIVFPNEKPNPFLDHE